MKPVTIDNLDLEIHNRYARDQKTLDAKYIDDAPLIPLHFEITSTSFLFSSKLDDLFETQIRNIPWALFAAPISYKIQLNRFFSARIVPWATEEKREDKEKQDEEPEKEELSYTDQAISKALNAKRGKNQIKEIFDREKISIINLLESMKYLNELLDHINSRKVQQKG